jgi:hypothetical protein
VNVQPFFAGVAAVLSGLFLLFVVNRWYVRRLSKRLARRIVREFPRPGRGDIATQQHLQSKWSEVDWASVVFAVAFTMIGIVLAGDGNWFGWVGACLFGAAAVLGVMEPFLPPRRTNSTCRVVVTDRSLTCEHARHGVQSIQWTEVLRIFFITTSHGHWSAGPWLVFEGEGSVCAVPTEAAGIQELLGHLSDRFPRFDFEPLIAAGTTESCSICWQRQPKDEN